MALTYDNVTYDWAGEYGLLAEIIGATRMNKLTNVTYVLPVKPPAVDPDVEAGNLTEKKALTAKALHEVKLVNYAIVEGFRQGFGENFRETFDAKYWEQLKEDVFKYKRITPRQYIEHLETKWVKQDPIVKDRLLTKFF